MNFQFNRVIITGAAGFIGFHLSMRLLKNGCHVTGIDNLNSYYDVKLKEARLEKLTSFENFSFYKMDISDKKSLEAIFNNTKYDVVVNKILMLMWIQIL